LLNSNVDWGQDLLFLERWAESADVARAQPVFVAFHNAYSPFSVVGDHFKAWPFRHDANGDAVCVPEGLYAISVNLLYEFPEKVWDRDGWTFFVDRRPLRHLRSMEPIAWAGYSVRVFSAEQVRRAYSLSAAD
jgi:hypothetical protein